ncbi:NAC domain-containing protein 83-like [Impatiens glandulifera]|uniref:NAC domain-containing protein 83-like n=1 Tax=Impatiens glandulifera TaxID=253017 RepID=UPI001FB0C175|nr:NAC domain-containing protein 83-like [Impatiens glandulifera]
MERLNLVQSGFLTRLPTGFRFEPTDEEIILHYLHNKVMSRPLPPYFIPVIDVCKSDPWNLPGNSEKERYYFFNTHESMYPNGDMPNCSGYWKDIRINKEILVVKGTQVIVGMKKILIFYTGNSPYGSMTDWIMHQYSIPASAAADGPGGSVINPLKKIKLSEGSNDAAVAMDDYYWVLNKVFRKQISERMMRFISNRNAAPASSDSSVITIENSPTREPDHQEEASSRNP